VTFEPELIIPPSGITTRILLLSLLSARPMHGYALRQVMEQRHMHRWANVQQMTREGLLVEEGEEREGNRPPRTVFRISDAGREMLKTLLRQVWKEPALLADPVDLALSLVMHLPTDEVIRLLHQRLEALDALEAHIQHNESYFNQKVHQPPVGVRNMIGDVFLHRRMVLDAERRWTQHVLHRLQSSAYNLSPEEHERVMQHRANPNFQPSYQAMMGQNIDQQAAPEDSDTVY